MSDAPTTPTSRYVRHVETVDVYMEKLLRRFERVPTQSLIAFADFLTYEAHMLGKVVLESAGYGDGVHIARIKGRQEAVAGLADRVSRMIVDRSIVAVGEDDTRREDDGE